MKIITSIFHSGQLSILFSIVGDRDKVGPIQILKYTIKLHGALTMTFDCVYNNSKHFRSTDENSFFFWFLIKKEKKKIVSIYIYFGEKRGNFIQLNIK